MCGNVTRGTLSGLGRQVLMCGTLLLAACSGGGSGGASDSMTVQGTVAQGAALAYASVTLVDAKGVSQTTQADVSGNYVLSMDARVHPLPYAFAATAPGGTTQYSVLLELPAAGQAVTVNINPLTTAVLAGALSSGRPQDIVLPVTLNSVQASDLVAAQALIRQSLQRLLTDAGVAESDDLILTAMNADHTGLDRVLDEIDVEFVGTGVTITNVLNTAGSNESLIVNKAAVAQGTAIVFSLNSTNRAVVAAGNFTALRDAVQACVSQSAAERVSNGVLSRACQAGVATDFLENGQTFATRFAKLLASSTYTNAVVLDPKVLFVESATRVMLQLTLATRNGRNAWTTGLYAEKRGGVWVLCGNQLAYDVDVTAFLGETYNGARGWGVASHKYVSGLYLYVSSAIANIDHVVVTGPGLPVGGVTLAPSTVESSMLAIANKTGLAASTTSNSGNGVYLDAVSVAADGASTAPLASWPSSSVYWSDASLTDFAAFKRFPAYGFALYLTDHSVVSLSKRLLISPKPAAAGVGFAWASPSSDTLALLSTGQSASGSYAVSWALANTDAVVKVQLYVADDSTTVYTAQALASGVSAATLVPPSGTSQFPGPSTWGQLQLDYQHPGTIARDSLFSF